MKIVRRYSLRLLLLVVTAACVAAAVFATYLPRGGPYTDDEALHFRAEVQRRYAGPGRWSKTEIFDELCIDEGRLVKLSLVDIAPKYAFQRYRLSPNYAFCMYLVPSTEDPTPYESDKHLAYALLIVPFTDNEKESSK